MQAVAVDTLPPPQKMENSAHMVHQKPLQAMQPHYYQNKQVRVHRPEGALGDEWYPHREALLYRDRKFLSSLREHLVGTWYGHWLHEGKRNEFTFVLHFDDSRITGEGQDLEGAYTLEGTFNHAEMSLQILKKYNSHAIEFSAHYKGDRAFSGEWRHPGKGRGFFEVRKGLECGQGLLPSPTELAQQDLSLLRSLTVDESVTGDWVGHCTQGNNLYDLKLSLVFNKGSVSGGGNDFAGQFTWSGMYDAREMHLSLIKTYPTHRVYFNGFYKSNKTFEGDWVLDDFANGAFRVTKQ